MFIDIENIITLSGVGFNNAWQLTVDPALMLKKELLRKFVNFVLNLNPEQLQRFNGYIWLARAEFRKSLVEADNVKVFYRALIQEGNNPNFLASPLIRNFGNIDLIQKFSNEFKPIIENVNFTNKPPLGSEFSNLNQLFFAATGIANPNLALSRLYTIDFSTSMKYRAQPASMNGEVANSLVESGFALVSDKNYYSNNLSPHFLMLNSSLTNW